MKEMTQDRLLDDIFYPSMTTLPTCFNLPNIRPNVAFALRPHYPQMLRKFTGVEGAYLFFKEFEEVCSMMNFLSSMMKLIPNFFHILLCLLLQRLAHPISQGILLMVSLIIL